MGKTVHQCGSKTVLFSSFSVSLMFHKSQIRYIPVDWFKFKLNNTLYIIKIIIIIIITLQLIVSNRSFFSKANNCKSNGCVGGSHCCKKRNNFPTGHWLTFAPPKLFFSQLYLTWEHYRNENFRQQMRQRALYIHNVGIHTYII